MESLELDKEWRSYDQNTVGDSRWALLSRGYKMDFALFIFIWICFISNFLLFFSWVLGEERPIVSLLPSSHVLLQASARFLQVRGRRRSLHARVTLEDFFSICKWIEHVKKWRDWCANHTNSNVSEFKSRCYMPRIIFRHLSYQLLPKETPQEANCTMVDSFTLLISKP